MKECAVESKNRLIYIQKFGFSETLSKKYNYTKKCFFFCIQSSANIILAFCRKM
jgi:hypothetical protein